MSEEHGQALPAGYELDGYHIEAVLGAGGFGITYRAREVAIKRTVAIKEFLPAGVAMRGKDATTVRPISAGEAEVFEWGLERFRGEAETLVRFDHPNIVRVYRYFQANGTGYLVMQYVEGDSLHAILERAGTLGESEVREVLEPILDGLERVHAAGFLHRDIKPANIYIRSDGVPVLIDFGSARLALGEKSKSLTAIVSGGYAPFEQYSSTVKQGPWTDIYALGATLYRAVTGRAPPDAMDRIVEDEIVLARGAAGSGYSDSLLDAIDAALAMKGEDRPQSIAAFRAMLDLAAGAASAGEQEHAAPATARTLMPQGAKETATPPPAPPSPPSPRERQKSKSYWDIAALIAVVVAGGGFFGWEAYQDSELRQAETAAVAKRAAERARQAAAAAEARRQSQEEATRRAAAEARRQAQEEATRRAAAEARRQAHEEATRRAAEGARRKAAEAARRKAAEAARRRSAEAAKRRAAEQARRVYQAELRLCRQKDTGPTSFAACNRLISGGRVKGRPLAFIYILRGVKYGRRTEYRRALSDFSRSIALAPNAGLGYYYRGVTYSQLGNARQAINNYNRAIFLQPKRFRAYYNRGVMHLRLGDRSNAVRDFRTAVRLKPSYAQARAALRRLGISP